MKSKRRKAVAAVCCAVMAIPFSSWAVANTQLLVGAADYNSPIPISVDTENDYFEVVDDVLMTKQSGYYLSVFIMDGYYQTSVNGEGITNESLDSLISTCFSERLDSLFREQGTGLTGAYGDDNYLLIYSADGVNYDVCYKVDLKEYVEPEPAYNLYMRYMYNEEASAAEDYFIAQYDCHFKIDTEHYDGNYVAGDNTPVNPPDDAHIVDIECAGVNADGEDVWAEVSGLDEGVTYDDVTITFTENGTYTVYATTTMGIELSHEITISSIKEEVVADIPESSGDVTKPTLSINFDSETELAIGQICPVTITSDEPVIFIVDGEQFGTVDNMLTECTFNATYSGTFKVTATDASDNTSWKQFTVKVFSKDEDAHKEDQMGVNDNPINNDNMDTYWEISNLSGTVSGNGGSGNGNGVDKLPQTGGDDVSSKTAVTTAVVGGSAVGILGIGAAVAFLFKKRGGANK